MPWGGTGMPMGGAHHPPRPVEATSEAGPAPVPLSDCGPFSLTPRLGKQVQQVLGIQNYKAAPETGVIVQNQHR